MYLSRFTFYSPGYGENAGKTVVGNYLTGSLDLIDGKDTPEFLRRVEENNWEGYRFLDLMKERGYILRSKTDEDDLLAKKRREFEEEYRSTQTQLIFTPTYVCNLACGYCYQVDYHNETAVLKRETIDAFFGYVLKQFRFEPVKPYITLFGGEPLLGGNEYMATILYFLEKARDNAFEVAIVTNGYELARYIPEFAHRKIPVKEIQVTLDGGKAVHDSRRPTKSGEGTFDKVTAGINLALGNGYRVNLRAIVDKENMRHLPDLARHAEQQGWLDYPASQFQTTLGRNYELHFCQAGTPLYERAEMWRDFVETATENPVLHKYHKPQFHGMRTLAETGELPEPIFDGCPAGKKEWAFDFRGNIYGCTASVGVEKYRLGSFLTGEVKDPVQIEEWKARDVFSIPECQSCSVSLSCGGGCGVLAANRTGKILSPDCRPVGELVAMGLDYYHIGQNGQNENTDHAKTGECACT